MVTHTRNSCSAINPSRVHTHTVNTHPEQWATIYAVAPGEQLGVRCHLCCGARGAVGGSVPFMLWRPGSSWGFGAIYAVAPGEQLGVRCHLCCGARGAVGGSVPFMLWRPGSSWGFGAIYAAAPGEQLGVRCLAQGLLSHWGWRELYIHSPTYNSCRSEIRTCKLWVTSPTL